MKRPLIVQTSHKYSTVLSSDFCRIGCSLVTFIAFMCVISQSGGFSFTSA